MSAYLWHWTCNLEIACLNSPPFTRMICACSIYIQYLLVFSVTAVLRYLRKVNFTYLLTTTAATELLIRFCFAVLLLLLFCVCAGALWTCQAPS